MKGLYLVPQNSGFSTVSSGSHTLSKEDGTTIALVSFITGDPPEFISVHPGDTAADLLNELPQPQIAPGFNAHLIGCGRYLSQDETLSATSKGEIKLHHIFREITRPNPTTQTAIAAP